MGGNAHYSPFTWLELSNRIASIISLLY